MTRETTYISIARDFSDVPTVRFRHQGPASGEAFREDFLKPILLESSNKIIVNIDDVEGYGSSFLEEAFGGLVRKRYSTYQDLKARLVISSEKAAFKHFVEIIWGYIKKAKPER